MTNLGDLEIFTRVVATGSMSAAGRALGFSPAVVSKRIRRLEDRLGTRLFQRTTRQISLTEAGQGFHDRILGVLAGIDEAEAFATGRSQLAQGGSGSRPPPPSGGCISHRICRASWRRIRGSFSISC